MSKSTTGAYGDYPDYYYDSGNQFGAYLLGKTPKQSWDARMEGTLVPSGGPYVAPAPRAPRPRLAASTHDQLMTWIRGTISRSGARRILETMAAERGYTLPEPLGDPYLALDQFALDVLTEQQQRVVLKRLRDAYMQATRPRRSRPRSRGPKSSKPLESATSRRRLPKTGVVRPTEEKPTGVDPRSCSLCGRLLTKSEQAESRRDTSIFLGHGYCTGHAAQVRGLFTGVGC